jgi:hypothetical protein
MNLDGGAGCDLLLIFGAGGQESSSKAEARRGAGREEPMRAAGMNANE